MNKISTDEFEAKPVADDKPLSRDEVRQLRAILDVVQYDATSETFRIDVGDTKLLVRKDGNIRIEGKRVTTMAQGSIILNGAAIELN